MERQAELQSFPRAVERMRRRLLRRAELFRGWLMRLRGAQAGERFGLGPGVRIFYPDCLVVGDDVTIEGPAYLHCLSQKGVRIGHDTSMAIDFLLHCGGTEGDDAHGFFTIGHHGYIAPHVFMGAGGGITIGDHVMVGPSTVISSENHLFDDLSRPIYEQGVTRRGVIIEDDCWIGAKVVVLDGVTIGHGAVVAAGAVVTRSVPPYGVVAGVPARLLRHRGESR